MGCFCSKIGPPPSTFTRDLSLSLKKKRLDDHFLSLLHSLNKLQDHHHHRHHDDHVAADDDNDDDDDDDDDDPPEIINIAELMADLEEDQEQDDPPEETNKHPILTPDPAVSDAQSSEGCTSDAIQHRPSSDLAVSAAQLGRDCTSGAIQQRKAKARGLVVKVPSFDFYGGEGRAGCDGSYETPRFGKYARRGAEECGVFDTEMVAELEEAMEKLSEDEEEVIRRIIEECLEGANC